VAISEPFCWPHFQNTRLIMLEKKLELGKAKEQNIY
jgi:hypothetical protein